MNTTAITITERIEAIEKECSGVWSVFGITSWERARLSEWKGNRTLSPKQMAVLNAIEHKAFRGAQDN